MLSPGTRDAEDWMGEVFVSSSAGSLPRKQSYQCGPYVAPLGIYRALSKVGHIHIAGGKDS